MEKILPLNLYSEMNDVVWWHLIALSLCKTIENHLVEVDFKQHKCDKAEIRF